MTGQDWVILLVIAIVSISLFGAIAFTEYLEYKLETVKVQALREESMVLENRILIQKLVELHQEERRGEGRDE